MRVAGDGRQSGRSVEERGRGQGGGEEVVCAGDDRRGIGGCSEPEDLGGRGEWNRGGQGRAERGAAVHDAEVAALAMPVGSGGVVPGMAAVMVVPGRRLRDWAHSRGHGRARREHRQSGACEDESSAQTGELGHQRGKRSR